MMLSVFREGMIYLLLEYDADHSSGTNNLEGIESDIKDLAYRIREVGP